MLKLNIMYTQQSEKVVVKTDYEALCITRLKEIRRLLKLTPGCELRKLNAKLIVTLRDLKDEVSNRLVLEEILLILNKEEITEPAEIYGKLVALRTCINNYTSRNGLTQPKSRVKY
jgi:hypothetical protein